MADQLRFYIVCPSCGGTGLLNWGSSPGQGGTHECPLCKPDEGNPVGPAVFDRLRHVYHGHFEEVEDLPAPAQAVAAATTRRTKKRKTKPAT